MKKLILVNTLSDLLDHFDIRITKSKILFESKNKQELNTLKNYFLMEGYSASMSNGQLRVEYDSIDAKEAEYCGDSKGHSPKILPQLDILKLIYPPVKRVVTLKAGEYIQGEYLRDDKLYDCLIFQDENNDEFSLQYAQLNEFTFKAGVIYEIECKGSEPKTKQNRYPRKIFEIRKVSI